MSAVRLSVESAAGSSAESRREMSAVHLLAEFDSRCQRYSVRLLVSADLLLAFSAGWLSLLLLVSAGLGLLLGANLLLSACVGWGHAGDRTGRMGGAYLTFDELTWATLFLLQMFLEYEPLTVVQFSKSTVCGGLDFSRASLLSSSLCMRRIAQISLRSIAA